MKNGNGTMDITVKEVLIKARNKIANWENWCRFTVAKRPCYEADFPFDETALISCGAQDPLACQWCATGAVTSAIPLVSYDAAPTAFNCYNKIKVAAVEALNAACPNSINDIVGYNDHAETRHSEIISVFDKAIKELGK